MVKKPTKNSDGKKSKYDMMDEIPHMLHRPDTYIGTIQSEKLKQWIYSGKESTLSLSNIEYIQGYYKIFDEILVNAYDHTIEDTTCTEVRITLDKEKGTIKVWNNGKGIPITKHKVHKIYIPTMLFGNLRSSSNYDDSQKKLTGGRNGFGAKLANIYSVRFSVETIDSKRKKKFKQVWKDHMQKTDGPEIEDYEGESYTSFEFTPDYKYFKMDGISDDIFNLMKKRAYDIAMVTNEKVNVYFNDKKIKEKTFEKYISCYFGEQDFQIVIDDKQKRWKVAMVYDPYNVLEHKNVSFVNGICTYKGGKHVNHVVDQIVDKLLPKVKAKVKAPNLTADLVKKSLVFFINCQIENPTFDSQTKENMTLQVKNFGSAFKVSDAFVKKMLDTGIVDDIAERLKSNDLEALSKMAGKKTGRISGIPKLEDAHCAGTKKALECTLILTEGDSAKTLAVAGLSAIEKGRDYYGVFPLRGKLLNVRSANSKQIMENAEIQAIMKIMGFNPKQDDATNLRYGRIMIMADQDLDGFHIKGLIMNFLDHFFPKTLRKHENFLVSLVTPIVKSTKGKEVIHFYNLNEFNKWYEENAGKGWSIKYYKGLGTSTPKEAREYFSRMDECLISYYCKLEKEKKEKEDLTRKYMNLAFRKENNTSEGKKDSDRRKEWINEYYSPDVYIERSQKEVSVDEFINKEMIQFSNEDNVRSLPNIMDGHKPSTRKVLHTALKIKLDKEVKLTEFQGEVNKNSGYHHGEVSLYGAIIGMAQNYTGSNNISHLEPKGMFGTRREGGKDHASQRYIFTNLNPLVYKIINPIDNAIIKFNDDDGKKVEPQFYCPVICMLLVNGSEGIGTGWATKIPGFNPLDIIKNTRRIIQGKEPKAMVPWYRHFRGTIEQVDDQSYSVEGIVEIIDDETVRVTELPVGYWTQKFKEDLENLIDPSEKGVKKEKKNSRVKGKKPVKKGSERKATKENAIVRYYKDDSSDVKVDFLIKLKAGYIKKNGVDGVRQLLGLNATIKTTNMYAFTEKHKIKKFNSPEEILKKFAVVRLKYYQKRKDYLLPKLGLEKKLLSWKLKFVEYVLARKIIIFNDKGRSKSKDEVYSQLKEHGFPEFIESDEETEQDASKKKKDSEPYKYTKVGIYNFTKEEVEKLRKQLNDKIDEIKILEGKTSADLWTEELDQFEEAYIKWDAVQTKEYAELYDSGKNIKKKSKKARSKKDDDL